MTTQISPLNRADLERSGYGIQFEGFEFNEISLFTHCDNSDKKRGDLFSTFRVNDKNNLDEYEANYLFKKATYGMFPWPPGEECVARSFFDVKYVKAEHGATRAERGESINGCKWCRLNNGSAAGAALGAEGPASVKELSHSVETEAPPAPVPATKKYPCPICKGGADTEPGFKAHMTMKHSSSGVRQQAHRRGKKK